MTKLMKTRLRRTALAALLIAAGPALAQGGAAGQGDLKPDTPVIAPTPPGSSAAPAPGASPGPRTPLPPRDTTRAAQPNAATAGGEDGPKTPLPPRDAPRAQQPGQRTAAVDPNWPCVQVKVPTLSYGQMWGGPPLDDALKAWRGDEKIEDLVETLAARRTKIDAAKAAIADFAKSAGKDADGKLTLVFAGLFETINSQRSQIMHGIERYAVKQRTLSEKIKAESIKIADEQKSMAEQNTPEALQQQQALDWDTRIYDERSQQLTFVCETPVILEQRAFDLGREIQAHLGQSSQ